MADTVRIDRQTQRFLVLEVEESSAQKIEIGDEASLTLVLLNFGTKTEKVTLSHHFSLGTGSTLALFSLTLGGDIEHVIRSECLGRNAVSDVSCISFAHKTEKQHIAVRNVFQEGNGGGEIRMKAVAEGKAHVKLDGLIDIGLQGGGTNTYLTQQVLMLDKTAKADAIPGLEIKTNDVKASHSATVSRITEEDLFTFAARGIREEEARAMFIRGFLHDMVLKIGDEKTVVRCMQAIEEKYANK